MAVPKVFISYSHETQEHKKWVLELATRLRNNGIDAILDQFELKPGYDIPHFMETHLASSDNILMVCTEKYVEKANNGEGGVGYEKMIITSSLMNRIDENKIIPIIRQNGTFDLPTFLKSKLYINFSKPDDYEFCYDELVRAIHNSPLFEKPPIGNNPFKPVVKAELDDDIKLINEVLVQVIKEQGIGNYTTSSKLVSFLKMSPMLFRVAMIKLIKLGYVEWCPEPSHVRFTNKGVLYAFENKLIN